MNRNFHNSRGSSTQAGNQNPRWRTVFLALVFAFAIGSAGHTPSAQAAPSPQQGFGYRLRAIKLSGGDFICVGDIVKINVRVTRGFENLQNVQQVPGVNVRASSSNDSIGWYAPTQANTGYMADFPGTINFKFHAEKAGTTTLTFEGTINHTWLGIAIGTYTRTDQVVLTVDECQYRVSGVSDFSVEGAFVGAVFKDAVMTLGSDGLYTGTATVQWFGYQDPILCAGVMFLDPATTKVELTGVRDDKGLFHLAIVYEPGETKWSATCYAAFVDAQKLDPWELKFAVPDSGEVGKLLYHGFDFALGQTTVTVIQEKTGGQ
jgi:hypothetical protein